MSWTSKVQKKYQNTQYIYKVHNKEKLLEKIRCTGRFDGIILFWHFLPLNFTSIKKRYYYKSYIVYCTEEPMQVDTRNKVVLP